MVDLDKLEELYGVASNGPWESHGSQVTTDESEWDVLHPDNQEQAWCDARLIAATRNALPALIAELRAARKIDARGKK